MKGTSHANQQHSLSSCVSLAKESAMRLLFLGDTTAQIAETAHNQSQSTPSNMKCKPQLTLCYIIFYHIVLYCMYCTILYYIILYYIILYYIILHYIILYYILRKVKTLALALGPLLDASNLHQPNADLCPGPRQTVQYLEAHSSCNSQPT